MVSLLVYRSIDGLVPAVFSRLLSDSELTHTHEHTHQRHASCHSLTAPSSSRHSSHLLNEAHDMPWHVVGFVKMLI